MNGKLKKIISVGVLALFACWTFYYVHGHLDEFSIIFHLSWQSVITLSILVISDSAISGLFTKEILQHENIHLSFREWYGLSVVSIFWNIVLPLRGGAGVRAIYLKKVHNFSYSNFIATLAALYFVTFFVNTIIGLFCIFALYYNTKSLLTPLLVFFIITFIAVSFVMFFSPRIQKDYNNYYLNKLKQALNSWHVIRTNLSLLKKLTVIILTYAFVGLLTVYFSYRAFGCEISFFQCLLISTLFSFSTLIKITPGALGITESIMILTGQLFHISPAQSLLAAGLLRSVNLCWIFILTPIFSYLLSMNIKDVFQE